MADKRQHLADRQRCIPFSKRQGSHMQDSNDCGTATQFSNWLLDGEEEEEEEEDEMCCEVSGAAVGNEEIRAEAGLQLVTSMKELMSMTQGVEGKRKVTGWVCEHVGRNGIWRRGTAHYICSALMSRSINQRGGMGQAGDGLRSDYLGGPALGTRDKKIGLGGSQRLGRNGPHTVGLHENIIYGSLTHAWGHLGGYTIDSLVGSVKSVLSDGVKKVWLSSEDTGAYGHDIDVNLPIFLNSLVDIEMQTLQLPIGSICFKIWDPGGSLPHFNSSFTLRTR